MLGSAAQMYKSVGLYGEIEEASPHKLISMLFDGVLQRIATAKKELEVKHFAEKGLLLGQAITIVASLKSYLDMDKGGELSQHLEALYDYIERRLLSASLANDVAILDEVTGLLLEIKGAWDQIA
ncbi:MAG: flagellar export chaperone FliS [Gammaproteobacteria bacterium]|nr:flagellar export chaperone FliS [Gammaproteobacteria bacterium]